MFKSLGSWFCWDKQGNIYCENNFYSTAESIVCIALLVTWMNKQSEIIIYFFKDWYLGDLQKL